MLSRTINSVAHRQMVMAGSRSFANPISQPNNDAPVRVAVTGAAGNIAYSILYRIAAGEFLGKH